MKLFLSWSLIFPFWNPVFLYVEEDLAAVETAPETENLSEVVDGFAVLTDNMAHVRLGNIEGDPSLRFFFLNVNSDGFYVFHKRRQDVGDEFLHR